MPKVTLTLEDIVNLEIELNGLTNQQTNETIVKGLLSEKLKLKTKYWLNELSRKLIEERKAINELRDETLKKYIKEGQQSLPMFIDEIKDDSGKLVSANINPSYVEFDKEFSTLLKENKDIDCHLFDLNEFEDVETERNYKVFFKLIKVDE